MRLRDAGPMVIREAKAEDWPAIWLILKEEGTAGQTLTWDPARTEARARAGWMREPPGRTIVAVDDDGGVLGSADTHPIHPGRGRTLPTPGLSSIRHGEVGYRPRSMPPCPGPGAGGRLPGDAVQRGCRNQYAGDSIVALVRLSDPCHGPGGVPSPGLRIRWAPHHVQKALKLDRPGKFGGPYLPNTGYATKASC